MMAHQYIQPFKQADIEFTTSHGNKLTLKKCVILEAIKDAHEVLDKFTEFGVDVFSILGMTNLSSFIGEVFVASLIKKAGGLFKKNPRSDGYPDLLAMDAEGLELWRNSVSKEKKDFSPFKNGGIEVKATCGDTPSAEKCKERGISKPSIGDQRINVLTGYLWKAHHTKTNNLLGILWDFIAEEPDKVGVPRIVAVFFSDNLEENDWGKVATPKEGGGNTTSVSSLKKVGVKKMYQGTVWVINDVKYLNFLNRYNRQTLL